MNWLKRLRHPLATLLTRRLLAPFTFLLAAALTACGGGAGSASMVGSSSSCGAATCGAAVVTITDAPGDFLSYTVNIVSLQLKRDDGTVVETLPVTTTVDFAKLVDLSEIISARQIPPGKYVGGTVTLDYTNATIVVDDGSANGLQVAPVDNSNPPKALGQVAMAVQLDSGNPLLITDRSAGHIAFDFNLLASNTVSLSAKTVTVSPVLVASIVPPDHKDLRVRGPLVSADTTANSYSVTVQPFYSTSTSQGDFTVHVNAATSYEIDGAAYTGDAGLAKLATMAAGTLTAAFGTLNTADQSFTATRVLAGTSVENAHEDGIDGVVVKRSGNTLTIRGVTIEHHEGDCGFDGHQATVTVDDTTGVTREGQANAFAIKDISVGQRIHAFGKLGSDPEHPALDATGASGGHVRLEITSLWGLVNSATAASGSTAGSVAIALQAIEGRSVTNRDGSAAFDFTGVSAASADDPAPGNQFSYLIDTGVLALPDSFKTAGNPARFFGFVTPFGTAAPKAIPSVANFTAVTLVDYAQTDARLRIDWQDPGTTAPFVTPLASAGLTPDLTATNLGDRHYLSIGPLVTDLTKLTTPLKIVGDMGADALFAITHEAPGSMAPNSTTTYASFGDFVTALTSALDGTNTAEHVVAEGTYNSTTGTFTATHMAVVLEN